MEQKEFELFESKCPYFFNLAVYEKKNGMSKSLKGEEQRENNLKPGKISQMC